MPDPAVFSQLLVAIANASPVAVITLLYLYLFLDTRDANNKREAWFWSTVAKHDATLDSHIEILRDVTRQLVSVAERLERIERRLDKIDEDVKDKPAPSRRG